MGAGMREDVANFSTNLAGPGLLEVKSGSIVLGALGLAALSCVQAVMLVSGHTVVLLHCYIVALPKCYVVTLSCCCDFTL